MNYGGAGAGGAGVGGATGPNKPKCDLGRWWVKNTGVQLIKKILVSLL